MLYLSDQVKNFLENHKQELDGAKNLNEVMYILDGKYEDLYLEHYHLCRLLVLFGYLRKDKFHLYVETKWDGTKTAILYGDNSLGDFPLVSGPFNRASIASDMISAFVQFLKLPPETYSYLLNNTKVEVNHVD